MYICKKKYGKKICMFYAINNYYQEDKIKLEDFNEEKNKIIDLCNFIFNIDKTMLLIIPSSHIFTLTLLLKIPYSKVIDYYSENFENIFIVKKQHIYLIKKEENIWYKLDDKITKTEKNKELFFDYILLPFTDKYKINQIKMLMKIKKHKFNNADSFFTDTIKMCHAYLSAS